MDPLTALLALYSYEKCIGLVLTDEQICAGQLPTLLKPEDFTSVTKVLACLLLPFGLSLVAELEFVPLFLLGMYWFSTQTQLNWSPLLSMSFTSAHA